MTQTQARVAARATVADEARRRVLAAGVAGPLFCDIDPMGRGFIVPLLLPWALVVGDAPKVVPQDVSELSEETAQYLAAEHGEALTKALSEAGVIGPFRVMRHFTAKHGSAWQAHHIYETARMIKAGLDPLDGPSVVLSKEVHEQFTNKLAVATKGIERYEVQELWEAYKQVYEHRPEWLKAIAHYFGE